ncbi:tRNA (adenosine(37)-N6)-threonylcarbamoyltransferase complex ATPase subunit type 1 TsaE [Mycoplasma phocoenae]|uniref:tRNA threonylcarbamoyladenosine biosynthesis protein TsaE n=1 Tax=Mycoplasma phocoenae TaxID=754517 RepID=A0A858U262_9MOLU|nr:tRNA (adenosine(37)-N6)-threonylcarbamoyltransferase complex ATPase subunit type 1 TsaE [Mycoplasma phocoenae]QJG67234.1 tRNA (adenosine(37)-N6)-threonylcarbamoyltransferase complex ATPase subunit type 1 TsaE [Mycoplasma phocoenae]
MRKLFTINKKEELSIIAKYLLSFENIEAILLNGEMGSGKTTLTTYLAKEMGIQQTIISPTFNGMLIYPNLVHIDAYKLRGDLEAFEDYFEDSIVVIEWPEKINHSFKHYINVNIVMKDNNRIFEIEVI